MFDSKYEETVLRRPVSLKKLLEVARKTLELGGTPTFTRKGRVINVSDQSTFDYSILGEAITSFTICLDQLLVGFDLEKLGHDAFENSSKQFEVWREIMDYQKSPPEKVYYARSRFFTFSSASRWNGLVN